MIHVRYFGLAAVTAVAVLSAGCDWFVEDSQRLAGQYLLVRSGFAKLPSGRVGEPTFGLSHSYKDRALGAALSGSVEQLGWNNSVILARRTVEGHPNLTGWIIISVQNGSVDGPMSDAAFEAMRSSTPAVSAIQLMSPGDAWSGKAQRR
jgi:hypothetical protein